MDINHSKRSIASQPVADREAWMAPALKKLRAGAAENTPGITISDVPLETMGS